ncbi:MAG: UDP-N-acetylmuramoyl-L-alanyl-D-glutamate--2,6-diaminopimelate ligase [Bdellovibrionota bacterium]
MKVDKFPKILFQSKELVWDTRQVVEQPQIVIRKHLANEAKEELRSRGATPLVEGVDFPSFGSLCAELVGNPSHKLKVIGVVGTNGKTTTAALLRFLLVEEGKRVLEIGTLGAMLWASHNNETPLWSEKTGFTSPDVPTLQDLLRQALEDHVSYVVMEVTSHAIALGRVEGVEFDAGIFLNFSQDHLDFHKTLEEYKRVKKSFFTEHLKAQKVKTAPYIIINANDMAGAELSYQLRTAVDPTVHVLLKRWEGYEVDEESLELAITLHKKETFPIVGHFQAENLLSAAMTVAALLDLKNVDVLMKLKKFTGLPGRMEIVTASFKGVRRSFIVDFAHTPDALEKNLQSLRMGLKKGKLWLLFGCGGDRDASKRPIMGEVAAKYADHIVVTSDNPRSEDPDKIISEIVEPLKKAAVPYIAITSRKEAMKHCLEHMNKDDICLVAGRGHEDFQLVGDQKIPFRDADVLRSLGC